MHCKNLKKIIITTLLFIFPLLACGNDYQHVSIISLIGQPEVYEGKKVVVSGYLEIEHEGDALYLSKNDAENVLTKNAIWVELDSDQVKKWQPLTNSYVTLFGKYTTKSKGHFSLFSGAFEEVFQIHQKPDPKIFREAAAKEKARNNK